MLLFTNIINLKKGALLAVFLFASLNIQAQVRECDTNTDLLGKNQQEHQDKPSTKTVVNNKIKKSKSASSYFGMFKMLIPVSSK